MSYIWTADKHANMKAIFAAMNTTWAVVEITPEKKNQACKGFEPMTSAIPVHRSTELPIWEIFTSESV